MGTSSGAYELTIFHQLDDVENNSLNMLSVLSIFVELNLH